MILTRHPQRLIKTHPGDFWPDTTNGAAGVTSNAPTSFTSRKLEKNQRTEILIFNSLDRLNPEEFPNDIFICGGAQIYEQALPRCSDLYLTLVKREIENGDAFFPPFEDKFVLAEEIRDEPEFKILHYRHKSLMR